MKAPVCRVCGAHHWSADPHIFKDPPIPVRIDPSTSPEASRQLDEGDIFTVGGDPQKYIAVKPPFDRSAYQREYMRKRRAAAKT